jgi:anti-sigma-K factor RskA
MSEDLEKRLQRMLRPVDPGDDFTRRVMSRVGEEEQRVAVRPHPWRTRGARRSARVAVAVAASIVLVAVCLYGWQQREKGIVARNQVIEALRVTNDKLDLANRLVNTPLQTSHHQDPGA